MRVLAGVAACEPSALHEAVELRAAIAEPRQRARVGWHLRRLASTFAIPHAVTDVERLFSRPEPTMMGWTAAFDRGGNTLLQSNRDHWQLWDLSYGWVRPWVQAKQAGWRNAIRLAWSDRVIAGTIEYDAMIYDRERRARLAAIPGRQYGSVAFHPERREAIARHRARLEWLEGEPPMRVRATLEADGIDDLGELQFAADGALLIASDYRTFWFLDPDSGVRLGTLRGARSPNVHDLASALSLDARYAIAADTARYAAGSNATLLETGSGRPYYRNPTMRVHALGMLGIASLQTRDDEYPSVFVCDRALRPLHELGPELGHVLAMSRDGGLLAVNHDGSTLDVWQVSCRWSTFEDLIDDAEAVLAGEARDRWPTPLDGNRLDHALDVWRDLRAVTQRDLAPAATARLATVRAGVVREIAALPRSYARGWIPDLADPVRRARLVDPSLI